MVWIGPRGAGDRDMENCRTETGGPQSARSFDDDNRVGLDIFLLQMPDQSPRPFLLAGRSFVANHAGEPEVACQFDPRLPQGGGGVDHSDQAALHVLGASSDDPVAITGREGGCCRWGSCQCGR